MDIQVCTEDTILKGRDAQPSHYLFKIQSFSLLSKASIQIYSSDIFEAGGYKWIMSIYPTGDKSRNGQGYISMYLGLVETSSLPAGWEVNVICNLFTFNQLQHKYVSTQDGRVIPFHAMKTKWGFPKFMDLKTFSNPLNGYLVDDTCVFGAEVFVVKSTFKGECLKLISEPATYKHTWKVDHFSNLIHQCYKSRSFVVGDYKWRILLYPKGLLEGEGTNLSLFLVLDETTLPSATKLFVKYTLTIKDQISGEHLKFERQRLFGPSGSVNLTWGLRKFISLAKMKDLKNGFLVSDNCIIEAVVTVLGSVVSVS